jgi:hypothetical protein
MENYMDSPKKKPLTSAPSEQNPTSEQKPSAQQQIEQSERFAEILARFDATSALIAELSAQLRSDIKPKMADPNWVANNPKLVRLYLESVKGTVEWTAAVVQFCETNTQLDLALAEKLRAQAATENDPETKQRLLSFSDHLSSRGADKAEKMREIGMSARQTHEMVVPICNLLDEQILIMEKKDGK